MKDLIKKASEECGFAACGITPAIRLDDEVIKLDNWLEKNYQAGMAYMKRNADLRVNPGLMLEGAKAVIVLLYNYYPAADTVPEKPYKISRYALGRDYHKVIRKRARQLIKILQDEIGEFEYRLCIDSAPVMEKALAQRAGLGWIGKNGCLINSRLGSFYFLAEIITDLEPEFDQPASDHCGKCRACLDACPTEAIVKPYVIDAGRCISYLTIEHKGDLPEKMRGGYREWIFGCDICQDVCPFNRFARPHNEKEFNPSPELLKMQTSDWDDLTEAEFDKLFEGSAVKRAGYRGLMRNIAFIRNQR